MFEISAILNSDYYKQSHHVQYSPHTEVVYSTWTPRKSRMDGVNKVVFFGLQYFIKDYLIDSFNKTFFKRPKEEVIAEFKRVMKNTIGTDDASHWEALHDLGYLPLKIDALPEGTLTPIRVPMFTIENTLPEFYWLTNFVETIMSTEIWKPMTSATIALQYRKICEKWAEKTCDDISYIDFQGHDFSMRGMAGVDAACSSGAGHLLSFKGTDTIPAVLWLEKYYNADCEKELIGTSIPATEHSVAETNIIEIQQELMKYHGPEFKEPLMNYGIYNEELIKLTDKFSKDNISKEEGVRELAEIVYLNRLLDVYPSGIFSYVADTYNLWEVLTSILPILKDKIMSRDGKVVIRPDSGDPCDIICGLNTKQSDAEVCNRYVHQIAGRVENNLYDMINWDNLMHDLPVKGVQLTRYEYHEQSGQMSYKLVPEENQEYAEQRYKGVIELLWEVFGGTINSKGYKVLDPHIGCIYGDAITLERAEEICRRLEAKGFASSNIVFGIGSYTYNMNTRDTFGFALKTTYGVVNGKELMLYKDPITDDGTKKSQKGMVSVFRDEYFDELMYRDEYTKKDKEEAIEMRKVHPTDEHYEMLQTVFLNGELVKEYNLQEIRDRLKQELVLNRRFQYASR